jgi:hypothetical protein
MNSPQNFLHGTAKTFVLPRTDASGRGVFALAANGSQTGEGYIQGQVQQVPAQSQNRGPGNSTGDGF